MGVIKNPVQQQLYVNYRVDLTPTFLDVTDAAVSVVVVVVVVIALVLVVMAVSYTHLTLPTRRTV